MEFEQLNKILGNPSWDIIVFFAFLAIWFFYGIASGRRRLITLLFSVYISGFLFNNFYYLDRLIRGDTIVLTFFARVFVFFIIVLAVYAALSRFIEGHYGETRKHWWSALLLSFLTTGLLFSYLFHLFPAREIFDFSPFVQKFFASDSSFFWWLTLPLVALFAVRK